MREQDPETAGSEFQTSAGAHRFDASLGKALEERAGWNMACPTNEVAATGWWSF